MSIELDLDTPIIKQPIAEPDYNNVTAEKLSELMETSPEIAAKIIELMGSNEAYAEYKHALRQTLSLDVSTEDFKEEFAKLLDRILAFLKAMAKDLFDGTAGMALTMERIMLRADRLQTDARSVARRDKATTFKINTRIQNLCVRYRPITEVQGLFSALRNLDIVARTYYEFQNSQMLSASLRIPNVINNEGELANVIETIMSVNPVGMAANNQLFRHSGYRHESIHLLGNRQLVVVDKRPDGGQVDRLLGIEVKLDDSERDPLPLPEEITFQRFSTSIEVSLLRQVVKTAEMLNRANNLSTRHRRRDRINQLTAIVNKVRDNLQTDQLRDVSEDSYRLFVRVIEAYIDWLANPYLGFMALCARDLTAILNVCEANI
ncbi:internal head protein [Pseudomonas phage PhiPA3]|uniref:Virion structural protein n=1 Tax=Pseudomonas phage PhiPA3 TaxID=998086 RepID=F8SJX8_BPPA3|nr:internal head protein [Pseudomonas phage PhiPA3]AEH03525.1 virion structural protein [Pseudomonas phage PhiPA3]